MKFLHLSVPFVILLLVLGPVAHAAPRACFEVETGTATAPVALEDESGASGGKCISIPEGVGKPPDVQGDASFTITVPQEGNYVVWARCLWQDGCGNSVRVSVDGSEPAILGEDGTYKRWHWVMLRGMTFKLTQGDHQFRLMNNEDGIKIDQILLLTDRLYVPVAVEKIDCTPKPGADPAKPAEGAAPAPGA